MMGRWTGELRVAAKIRAWINLLSEFGFGLPRRMLRDWFTPEAIETRI